MPDNKAIKSQRPPKHDMDPFKPYGWLHESEPGTDGKHHSVNTLFLTNKECSFTCVMCDLWKDTIDSPTPAGAIPEQIRFALDKLPPADTIKLYNNGNFFDRKAIPTEDYGEIAGLLDSFNTVIVENHPKLCSDEVPRFRDMLKGNLEVAMGLETIHPEVLPKLNKQITKENVSEAAGYLHSHDIRTRAFILLNPPFLLDPRENIEWCLNSVRFAFGQGISTCSIIPTRPGNGIMDRLLENGDFVPPTLHALEETFERALQLNQGRVFADTWDLGQFSSCSRCLNDRKNRLEQMNMEQCVLPAVDCSCHPAVSG